jgi:hypothetical protein
MMMIVEVLSENTFYGRLTSIAEQLDCQLQRRTQVVLVWLSSDDVIQLDNRVVRADPIENRLLPVDGTDFQL